MGLCLLVITACLHFNMIINPLKMFLSKTTQTSPKSPIKNHIPPARNKGKNFISKLNHGFQNCHNHKFNASTCLNSCPALVTYSTTSSIACRDGDGGSGRMLGLERTYVRTHLFRRAHMTAI